jgi:16S rRNA (uracil1498-N3)-methyltransferase
LGGSRLDFAPLPGPLVGIALNLFLLEEAADRIEWSAQDSRTLHLRNTLKAKDGDLVDFGVINGPRGKGRVSWQGSGDVSIFLDWKTSHPSDLIPVSILVGLSRPQTCRKIIEQGSALGVSQLLFFPAEKGELSYANSSLWDGEWQRLLVKGAEQAFSCHLPICEKVGSLEEAIEKSASIESLRLALDVYEASRSLADVKPAVGQRLQLAIGPERGWSDAERKQLRKSGFELCHLGGRVLRVETAMVASVGCLAEAFWSAT